MQVCDGVRSNQNLQREPVRCMYLVIGSLPPRLKAFDHQLVCTICPATEGACYPGPVNTSQSVQVHKFESLASQRSEPEILYCKRCKWEIWLCQGPLASYSTHVQYSHTQNRGSVRMEGEAAREALWTVTGKEKPKRAAPAKNNGAPGRPCAGAPGAEA